MAKKTTQMDDNGKLFTPTRAQRKSTERLIPLTPAPKTVGQKIRRALIG